MNATLEQTRFNMIEQQIRTWEVLDPVVLDLLKQVPREDFVPAQYLGLAFADLEIPIGHGQRMLSPKMEARIVQSLSLKPTDRVLEVGTGSGYMTALLAKLVKQVVSVDCIPEFTENARKKLQQHGYSNIVLETGDAAQGWQPHAPYDVIVLTGSLPVLPAQLQQQLAVGGRMFVVVGEAPVMEATLIQRVAENTFRSDVLFETCVPELAGAPQPERFSF